MSSGASRPADFYQGRNVTIVVGSGPGSFDLFARVLARHLGRFIAGNPNVIVQNMPSGGSLKAANYVFNVAPKDGTVLGYVTQNIFIEEALGTPGVEYVTRKFNWIGHLSSTANVTLTPKDSPVKTIEHAKTREVILSATGGVSPLSTDPILSNRIVGTKFKVINGYTDSVSAILALERGEVEGTTLSRSTLLSVRPDWDRDKKMNYLIQYAATRHPGFPDTPTILELAATEQQKNVAIANDALALDEVIEYSKFVVVRMSPAALNGHASAFVACLLLSRGLCCKLFVALRERNNRIRLNVSLNQCCVLAFVLESMLRDLVVKIVLQHNQGFGGHRNSTASRSILVQPGVSVSERISPLFPMCGQHPHFAKVISRPFPVWLACLAELGH